MKSGRLLTLPLMFAAISPALAGPASDVVRPFYAERIGTEAEDASRNVFVDPAKRQLDLNDKANDGGDMGCVDFGLALDAQDYDEDEIKRTLKLDETVSGESATVIVSFTNFERATRIEWTLKRVAGKWKIADIASKDNDWRLSQLPCQN